MQGKWHGMRIRVIPILLLASVVHAADPNLWGWWKCNDGEGLKVTDYSGHENHGTLVNPNGGLGPQGSLWYQDPEAGTVLSFSGDDTTGGYVNAGTTPPLTADSQVTWILWAKPSAGQALNNDILMGNRSGAPTWVKLTPRFFEFGSNASGYAIALAAMPSEVWMHHAVVKNGQDYTYYRDGQAIETTTINGTSGPLPLFLGGESSGERWSGRLRDVRLYDRALSGGEVRWIMAGGGVPSNIAVDPSPGQGAEDVAPDAVLSWNPGDYAVAHDVYFGTSWEAVSQADRLHPMDVRVSVGQTETFYVPKAPLTIGATYYWRVDEVNAAPDQTIFTGEVWMFSAEPVGLPVQPMRATASSVKNASTSPDKTIDGSGLADDLHSMVERDMWLSSTSAPLPAWIQYDFDQPYILHEAWIWNHNQSFESKFGFGAKEVVIESSLDGIHWSVLDDQAQFARAPGSAGYVHNTVVALKKTLAQHVRFTVVSTWGGFSPQVGLSEVRFFYVPMVAREPQPDHEATDVALDATLHWRSGRGAAKHEVYFGLDPNALALSKTVTDHRIALSSLAAEYDRTYYWRVDEVNEAATPPSWAGEMWSFSTLGYATVDDFESYDDTCKRIYWTWVDGYGSFGSAECGVPPTHGDGTGNGTGSTVGNFEPPFASQTVVHSGRQTLPLGYNNRGSGISETDRTFETPQDWTRGGIKTLVLFFRGDMTHEAGQVYVKINGVNVPYHGNAGVLSSGLWKQWNIDLASLTGANLTSVKTLTIGVSGSGSGTLYVDDIRLYREAPAVPIPADPGTTGLSASYSFEGDAKDASGKGHNGTLIGDPVFVASQSGFGQALIFDGVNDYVDLPIGTLIGTLSSATFATWMNFSGQGNAWQRIFDLGNSSTTGYLFLTPNAGSNGMMRFAITATGGGAESIVSSSTASLAGWHHMAVVIEGTTMTLQLFLDGDVVASGSTSVLPKDLGATAQNWLGRSQYEVDPYFNGMLDDFSIYNRALSEKEVRYLAGDR